MPCAKNKHLYSYNIHEKTYRDCASSPTTLADAATGVSQSLSLTVESVAKIQRLKFAEYYYYTLNKHQSICQNSPLQLCFLMCFWKDHCRFQSLSLLLCP